MRLTADRFNRQAIQLTGYLTAGLFNLRPKFRLACGIFKRFLPFKPTLRDRYMQVLSLKPPLLAPRPADSHKGSFGHVLAVGGDHGFGGAVIMAAEAALVSGAGMVSLATRSEHISAALTRRPEIMSFSIESNQQLELILERPSVLVLGPGLGQSEWSQHVFERFLSATQAMVVDADGLNLLSQLNSRKVKKNWVLTPHPGEAASLLNVNVVDIQADRLAAATELQNVFGGTIVLKGAGSIVCDNTGAFVCKLGNPAMSSAGMGDVLSGIIGGLLAQKHSCSEAAKIGTWAHARAGDLAAHALGRHLMATDIFPFLRRLW